MLQTTIESPHDERRNVGEMSMREIYAGIALWGLASAMGSTDSRTNKTNIWKPEHVADKAVHLADEMLKRLKRPSTS